MKRMKKFLALGLSVSMMSAMAVGVQAADDQLVNGRGDGDVSVSADADVDVDGYLTKDNIINSSGELTSGSFESLSQSSSSVMVPTQTTDSAGNTVSTLLPTYTDGNTPVDSSGSHVSWGDDATANSTQVIITAPTKLAFQVAGDGEAANIQLGEGGKNITGTIKNQSCYIDDMKMVTPKEVTVKASRNNPTNPAFALAANDADISAATVNTVKGVYLSLDGKETGRVDFAGMTTEATLGVLDKGSKAAASDGAQAVNPSSAKVYFSDNTGKATGVATKFVDDYDGSNLKTSYNVNMVFSVE